MKRRYFLKITAPLPLGAIFPNWFIKLFNFRPGIEYAGPQLEVVPPLDYWTGGFVTCIDRNSVNYGRSEKIIETSDLPFNITSLPDVQEDLGKFYYEDEEYYMQSALSVDFTFDNIRKLSEDYVNSKKT